MEHQGLVEYQKGGLHPRQGQTETRRSHTSPKPPNRERPKKILKSKTAPTKSDQTTTEATEQAESPRRPSNSTAQRGACALSPPTGNTNLPIIGSVLHCSPDKCMNPYPQRSHRRHNQPLRQQGGKNLEPDIPDQTSPCPSEHGDAPRKRQPESGSRDQTRPLIFERWWT